MDMWHLFNSCDHEMDFIQYRKGSGTTVEIYDIQVGTERRTGIGRQMVEKLIRRIKEQFPDTKTLFAITRIDNQIAKEFYWGIGFRIIAYLDSFYQDDERYKQSVDAIMYGLTITD